MTFSPEGDYLYAAAQNALLVFSRDLSSGRLDLTRRIQPTDGPNDALSLLGNIRDLSIDGTHTMLFVSGSNMSDEGHRRSTREVAIAAFEISSDPSNPAHRDTFSRLAWQKDGDIHFNVRSHVSRLGPFDHCRRLLPHAGRPAVDVVCPDGFFVVQWNPATGVLEAADAADTGEEDRFGNMLPYDQGTEFFNTYRQIAQSTDGAHFYVATDVASDAWGYADAVHIFERARAMTPAGGGADAGNAITAPTNVVQPNEPGDRMSGPPQKGMKGK